MKYVIFIMMLASIILTACQPQEQTLIRRTTYNIEDMCPNDNSTFCYYYVTDNQNITYNVSDNTTWQEIL